MQNFTDILDYDFTAKVEADFDEVAEGQKAWSDTIAAFYEPFHAHVGQVLADRSFNKVSRKIGVAPDGDKVIAAFGKFGAYVQKGEGERRQSASLAKGQLIETLTLEQALKLLELPRTVGQLDGVDIVVLRGRFGPYLKYGDKNVKLPRGVDPLQVDLETCIGLIREWTDPARTAPVYLAEFGEIKVIDGRFGPYIKLGTSNYKLPKGTRVSKLTEADCQAIIANSEPTKNSRKSAKK